MTDRRACEFCGGAIPLELRAEARFCSNAHRQAAYRQRHAPDDAECKRRHQRKLEGLQKKYEYRRRGQARASLQNLGLVPSNSAWLSKGGERDGERWDFDHTPVGPEVAQRSTGRLWLWSPADSLRELFIGFKDGPNPEPGWHSGPYWPRTPGDPAELWSRFVRDADVPHGYNGNSYEHIQLWGLAGEKDARIVYRAKWWLALRKRQRLRAEVAPAEFTCRHCGGSVKVKSVLNHKCPAVTRTYIGDEGVVPLFPDDSQPPTEKGDSECAA